jgi:hypothetical protein
MDRGRQADDLAAQAAEAVRRVIAEAEARAARIIEEAEAQAAATQRRAEAEAAQVRERAEADARGRIEAAKRALDELGGTLVAAASEALPKQESTTTEPDPEPEPEPAPEPEPEAEAPAESNGDDNAVRLVAMKLAVDGMDPAAIEAELIERFGPGDRSALLRDVISRVGR